MAIEFDDASSEYLQASSLIVAAPFSVSAWFYVDDDAADRRVFAIYGTGSNRHECRLDASPDKTISAVSTTLTEAAATSSNAWSANAWHHGLWTLDTTQRTATLDGGTTAVNTTSRTPTVANTGVGGPSLLMSGRVAELAVWDVDLSNIAQWEAVKASLAKGFSPFAVAPSNLVAWFRFLSGEVHDVIGSFVLSVNGTPTSAAHPRLRNRSAGRGVQKPAGLSPASRVVSLAGVYHRANRVVLAG